MAFKNIEKKGTSSMTLVIDDLDLSIVNSVRRIILSEIPNVAFDFDPYAEKNDITITTNTCALHNEFLAHRISLIPLCFDAKEIENFDSKKYRFVLTKKNTGTEILHVTTDDFEIYDESNVKYDKKFKNKIFPADPITKHHVLITKLKPNLYDTSRGEEVDLECFASVNIAKEHARWSPVSKCAFYNALDEKAVKLAEAEVKPLDKNKFHNIDKFRLFKKNKYDEPSSFVFSIDSECRLSPEYLMTKAFQILRNKITEFAAALSSSLNISNQNEMFVIEVTDTTHTLLNVLHSLIYNNTFRNMPPSENPLEFIGYHQSHPLDKKMILKVKFKAAETSISDLKEFLLSQCDTITSYLDEIIHKWA